MSMLPIRLGTSPGAVSRLSRWQTIEIRELHCERQSGIRNSRPLAPTSLQSPRHRVRTGIFCARVRREYLKPILQRLSLRPAQTAGYHVVPPARSGVISLQNLPALFLELSLVDLALRETLPQDLHGA